MTEARRRDAIVRMATDAQFAERVHTDPQSVAREYGLDADDLAVLESLREDSGGGAANVLDPRLSKSSLFFGGHHLDAAPAPHEAVASTHSMDDATSLKCDGLIAESGPHSGGEPGLLLCNGVVSHPGLHDTDVAGLLKCNGVVLHGAQDTATGGITPTSPDDHSAADLQIGSHVSLGDQGADLPGPFGVGHVSPGDQGADLPGPFGVSHGSAAGGNDGGDGLRPIVIPPGSYNAVAGEGDQDGDISVDTDPNDVPAGPGSGGIIIPNDGSGPDVGPGSINLPSDGSGPDVGPGWINIPSDGSGPDIGPGSITLTGGTSELGAIGDKGPDGSEGLGDYGSGPTIEVSDTGIQTTVIGTTPEGDVLGVTENHGGDTDVISLDAQGNVTDTVTHGDGGAETSTYDADGNQTSSTETAAPDTPDDGGGTDDGDGKGDGGGKDDGDKGDDGGGKPDDGGTGTPDPEGGGGDGNGGDGGPAPVSGAHSGSDPQGDPETGVESTHAGGAGRNPGQRRCGRRARRRGRRPRLGRVDPGADRRVRRAFERHRLRHGQLRSGRPEPDRGPSARLMLCHVCRVHVRRDFPYCLHCGTPRRRVKLVAGSTRRCCSPSTAMSRSRFRDSARGPRSGARPTTTSCSTTPASRATTPGSSAARTASSSRISTPSTAYGSGRA